MRVRSLLWTVGALCAFTGVLALVAPHQFRGPAYSLIQAQLPIWGSLFALVGAGLLGSASLGRSGRADTLTQVVAALALAALSIGFMRIGVWLGAANNGILALGVGLVPLLRTRGIDRELLHLVLGATLVVDGSLMLLADSRLFSPVLDTALPSLPFEGALFISSGLLLLARELPPLRGRLLASLLPLPAAVALLAHLYASNALANHIWTGIVYYGGFGVVLLVLPFVQSRLQQLDTYSLRMRLAMALAVCVAVPLLLAIAVDGAREQRSTLEHTLQTERVVAQAVANDVSDFVGLHQQALRILASFPDLVHVSVARQQQVLTNAMSADPAWLDLSILDASGQLVATSRRIPTEADHAQSLFASASQAGQPVVEVWFSEAIGRSVVGIGVPITNPTGGFDGMVFGSIESAGLMQLLALVDAGPGAAAYIVDRDGRLIVHPNPELTADLPSLIERASVRALVDGASSGSLRHTDRRRPEMLSGFARVPALSWGVVIEQSVASAMASTWQATDVLFGITLAAIALAAAIGVLVARQLTAPLARLTRRLESLDDCTVHVEVPTTSVTEIVRLSTVFEQMQMRLAARTGKQREAEAEVRALNAALEQRVADRTAELEVAVANLHAQISQRARIEGALRESEKRYRHIVEASPEPILVHSDGAFVYANPAAAELIGAWKASELIGMPVLAVVHPESSTLVRERIAHLTNGGAALPPVESRLQRLDGSVIEVESTEAAVTFDGRPAIQVLLRDVTERKVVERVKDELLSVISHELRTPLTSIRGSLGLLAGGLLGALPPKGQRMLDIAVSNADRLIRLLNDVLDLERMRGGRVTMERREVALGGVIEQAMWEMRGLAERANVRLFVDAVFDGSVVCDPDRLVQVLTNLLSNAIKFSSAEGQVWLSAAKWDDVVRFSVRDEGRGIPLDMLDSIFERFYQVDSSDSRAKGGTGLGLAICRAIVEQHGGTIWAESTLGEGSSFIFELPAPYAKAAPLAA